MTTPEPTPEAVEALAHLIAEPQRDPDWNECLNAARAVLAAGYVLPEWKPSRWYRAVDSKGNVWAEASDRDEVMEAARRHDRLERWWVTVEVAEWRDFDPESSS